MIKQVKIEKINIGDEKTGRKSNGQEWRATPIGINIEGEWHNYFCFEQADKLALQTAHDENKTISLLFFTKMHEGKEYFHFKMPSKLDILTERLDSAAKIIKSLEERIKKLEENNLTLSQKEGITPIGSESVF